MVFSNFRSGERTISDVKGGVDKRKGGGDCPNTCALWGPRVTKQSSEAVGASLLFVATHWAAAGAEMWLS